MCKTTMAPPSIETKPPTHVTDTEAEEEVLRRQVPVLLDTMNRSSTDANSLEFRAGEAQRRYKARLAEWSQLYDGLRVTQGESFSRVKPYYFASQELKAASSHMQVVAREFSEVSSQYATASENLDFLEAARLKDDRDLLEDDYVHSLIAFQSAQKVLESLRAQLGDDLISRASPHFEMLQEQQMSLAIEYNRINTLVERARAARCLYKNSMSELEKISDAVHEMRKAHCTTAVVT